MIAKIRVTKAVRPTHEGHAAGEWEVSFEIESEVEVADGREFRSTVHASQGGDLRNFENPVISRLRVPDWVCQQSVAEAVRAYFRDEIGCAMEICADELSNALEVADIIEGSYNTGYQPWKCLGLGPVERVE